MKIFEAVFTMVVISIGVGTLYSVDWRIAFGVWLVAWGVMLATAMREDATKK